MGLGLQCIGFILGSYRDNGKENGKLQGLYRGYIGIIGFILGLYSGIWTPQESIVVGTSRFLTLLFRKPPFGVGRFK